MGRGGAGKAVVLGEVTRRGAGVAEGVCDALHELLGDVFVELAGAGARGHDALDGAVVQGSERGRVAERGVEVGGVEAIAEQQDLPRLVAPEPRCSPAHQPEKFG